MVLLKNNTTVRVIHGNCICKLLLKMAAEILVKYRKQQKTRIGEMNMEETQKQNAEILTQIKEQLDALQTQVEKQVLIQSEQTSRLLEELDHYKKGSSDRFENQLLKAVIKIRMDIKRNLASERFRQKSAEELLEAYRYIFEDISDLLELQNCDEFQSEPGSEFDPSIHQAKIEPTEEPEKNRLVKCSLTPGFRKDGKTLVAERVVVYKYQ